jgi:cation transport regulator ChaB
MEFVKVVEPKWLAEEIKEELKKGLRIIYEQMLNSNW